MERRNLIIEKRKEAGKKGGRPKKDNSNNKEDLENEENQTDTKSKPNVKHLLNKDKTNEKQNESKQNPIKERKGKEINIYKHSKLLPKVVNSNIADCNPKDCSDKKLLKSFEKAVYNRRIYELFDNLYGNVPFDTFIKECADKICKEVQINRSQELNNKIIPKEIPIEVFEVYKSKQPALENINRTEFVKNIISITNKQIVFWLTNLHS